jgi:hypothetical protein
MKKSSLILFLLFSIVKICFSQDTFNSILLKVKQLELPFSTDIYKKDIFDLKNEIELKNLQSLKYILNSTQKKDLEYTERVFNPDLDAYTGEIKHNYNFSIYRKMNLKSSSLIIFSKNKDNYEGYYLSIHDKNGILRDKISIYKIDYPGARLDTFFKTKIFFDYKVKQFLYCNLSYKEKKDPNSKYFNKNSLVIIKTYEILDRDSKFKLIRQDTILSTFTKSMFYNYDKSAEKFDPFNE